MKFMEFTVLEELNTLISCIEAGDSRAYGRIEAYSCKSTVDDKKLKQYIDKKYGDFDEEEPSSAMSTSLNSTSPRSSLPTPIGTTPTSRHSIASSPRSASPKVHGHGALSLSIAKKTLFYLLATLNAAFPDYDFSDVKPEYFQRITSIQLVSNAINTSFYNLGNDKFAQVLTPKIWSAIEQVVGLDDVDMYSFIPDPDIEPDSEEGIIWSFYYFFYDRKLKRIVFFTCRATRYFSSMDDTSSIASNEELLFEMDERPAAL